MRTGVLIVAVLLAGVARPTGAQSGAVHVGAGQVRADQVFAVGDTVFRSGIAWTVDGAFGVGPATLAVRYLQGAVTGEAEAEGPDVVEGEAILWVAPLRWAALGIGPHLRAYVASGGTEHWTMWEVRGRGTAQLTEMLAAYAELWTVLGSGLPVAGALDRGLGLEGGLRVQFGRLPFSAQLRYRVNRLAVADDGRRETLEFLGVAFGIGRR